MRWLCWCSAVLVLAGCGGAARRDPFAYDSSAPLAIRQQRLFATSAWGTIRSFTFAGVNGSRVPAYLVAPNGGGRHPAALFLHGSGGTRFDLIGEAALLARRGLVTMTISYPNGATAYRPLVVDARRALDLLAARSDVDASRLGVFGFSLGGQLAAILAGDEPRIESADILGGRGNQVTLYWIRRAHAKLFFQAGDHDQVVPHDQLLALMRAAPGRPRIRWYAAGHELTRPIDRDLVAWMARSLR